MMKKVCLLLVVVCCVQYSLAQRGRKRKPGKDSESLDLDDVIDRLNKLEEMLNGGPTDGPKGGPKGGCSSNVHFFFHGDDDDHKKRPRGPPSLDSDDTEDEEGHEHSHDSHDSDEEGHHRGNDNDQHVHIHLHHDGPKGGPRGGPWSEFGKGKPGMPPWGNNTPPAFPEPSNHTALCLFHNDDNGVSGHAHFLQSSKEWTTKVQFHFDSIGEAGAEFPVHVHEFGDVSDNCANIGGHFDPIIDDRDVGDLGKLVSNSDGGVDDTWVNDTALTLFHRHSVIGRSMAVHDDDGVIACCVIGFGAVEGDGTPRKGRRHADVGDKEKKFKGPVRRPFLRRPEPQTSAQE